MSASVGGLEYGEAEALREGIPHRPLPQSAVELHGIQLTPGPGGEAAVKYEAEAQFVAERIEALLGEPAMIRQGRTCVRFDPGILSSCSVPQAAAPGITAGLWRPVAFRCLREQGAAFWTPARRRCSGHFSRFWTIRSRTFLWRRFWPARCSDLRRITWGASGRPAGGRAV